VCVGFIRLGLGFGGRFFEHDNEPLISIKGGKFLD